MDAAELSITHLGDADLADNSPLLLPGTRGVTAAHVWILPDEWLTTAQQAFEHTLSAEEQRRTAAFVQCRDAVRFAARRGLLRHLLARYRGCSPRDVRLVAQTHGKPVLAGPVGPPLEFSVAQTDGATVLAFADARVVGVDVQCRKHGLALNEIAGQVFSPREHADLRSAAPQDRERCFFEIWARKEALLKALGIGLLTDPVQYTTQASEVLPRWRAWYGRRELCGWMLRDLPLGTSLHAAIAVQPSAS